MSIQTPAIGTTTKSVYTQAYDKFSSFTTPVKVIAGIFGGIVALILTAVTLGGAPAALAWQHRSVTRQNKNLPRLLPVDRGTQLEIQRKTREGYRFFTKHQADRVQTLRGTLEILENTVRLPGDDRTSDADSVSTSGGDSPSSSYHELAE